MLLSVAIPDHNHAIVGLSAMQLNKHLYLQKPLHTISMKHVSLPRHRKNTRLLPKWVIRELPATACEPCREWIEADVLGEIEKVYCWTDRPVWPQGIPWPKQASGSQRTEVGSLAWNSRGNRLY